MGFYIHYYKIISKNLYTAILATLLITSVQLQAETAKFNFAQLATGWGHTCALTLEGGVKCWGDNRYYQLGDGTNIDKSYPVDVVGLNSSVVAISAGKMHTCALLKLGGVRCWGISGKQGDGTAFQQTIPVEVIGLNSDIKSISAGDTHTCALTNKGEVKCWGDNYNGKLGAGPVQDGYAPVKVLGINEKIIEISAGMFHTCALTTSNVLCWGDNYFSQLGDKSRTNSGSPVVVVGLNKNIKSISAGDYHNCALSQTGQVQCWGYNRFGQLGSGNNSPHSEPVTVSGLPENITSIVSSQHTCALTSDGDVKCWGYNKSGQVGDNTNQNRATPIDVKNIGKMKAIVAGKSHTCGVKLDGNIQCWGQLNFGKVSDNNPSDITTPIM